MNEIKTGNVKELWKISFPMMVSFFSLMCMLFVDRLYLSWYSGEALSAAVQAGTLGWGVLLGWITMASMSEVFASQYNGAKLYEKIGVPVWQMIWLAIFSFAFYIPFAYFGSDLIYDPIERPLEHAYFQTTMYWGPIFSMTPAIGGFFIGRGKAQILQWMSILGNTINLILDPLLIFGIEGFIPSMGIKGAAIATGVGSTIQAVILFFVFIKRKHREEYKTSNFHFNKEIFFKTIRVGLPPSVFVCIELFGWALFYHFMMSISPTHIYVAGVVQSIFMIFLFFGMGLEKGCIAIAGNMIGAGLLERVKTVLFSGIKLIGIYALIAMIPMAVYPHPIIKWFIGTSALVEGNTTIKSLGTSFADILYFIRIGLILSFLLLILESIRWIVNGILTAAGDTMFLLIAGAISIWCFLIIPTYVFVVVPKNSVVVAFAIWVLYGFAALGLLSFRFLQGTWKKKHLLETIEKQEEFENGTEERNLS
jgi:MATE family multidrug resistance protein